MNNCNIGHSAVHVTQRWASYSQWAASGPPTHFIQPVVAFWTCTVNSILCCWQIFIYQCHPSDIGWLCTWLCPCVCLCLISSRKQSVSKSNWWIFAKFVSDAAYILCWKRLTFGADHIQLWFKMADNEWPKFVIVLP